MKDVVKSQLFVRMPTRAYVFLACFTTYWENSLFLRDYLDF